jgi:DNA repair exonuclease SbcCD ATPase subunit
MNELLEELDGKISKATERLKTLKLEVSSLSEQLEQARMEEAAARMNRQPDIKALRDRVIELQADIAGTQRAWEMQVSELSSLQLERKGELAKIGQAQEPILQAEANEIAGEIYGLLYEAAKQLSELKARGPELESAMKALDAYNKEVGLAVPPHSIQKLRGLCAALHLGILKALEYPFPAASLDGKDLPAQEALVQALRAGSGGWRLRIP